LLTVNGDTANEEIGRLDAVLVLVKVDQTHDAPNRPDTSTPYCIVTTSERP
jgi:hypothetical protein